MNSTTDIPLYIIIPSHCQFDISQEEERCSRWKSCNSNSWSYSRPCHLLSLEDHHHHGTSSDDIPPPFPSLAPPRAPRRIASDLDLEGSSSSSSDTSSGNESISSPYQVLKASTNPSLMLRSFDSLSCEARLDLQPKLPRRSFTMNIDEEEEANSTDGTAAALARLLRTVPSSGDDDSSDHEDDDDSFFNHDSLIPVHCLDDSLPPRKPIRRHSEPANQLLGRVKTVVAAMTA